MSKKQTMQNVRVGMFVTLALAVLTVAVFVIGQERSMFTSKTRVYTSFADINGLVVGAPVRLAGLDVGRVTGIKFSQDLKHPEARIQLSIETEYMPRVRKDSHAFVDSKGLLGDKLINLSVGSPEQPQLQDGDYVQPKTGLSLEAVAKELAETAQSIGAAARSAERAVDQLASPETVDNLKRVTGSLAALLEEAEKGNGLAHALFYDPDYAKRTDAILKNVDELTRNAGAAAGRFDRMLARIEQGPGTLHSLTYGDEGIQAINELKRASTGIADLMQAINHGDGMIAALLHGEEGKRMVTDMAAFTDRLNRMSADMEKGRGTLGALLVDPSVYEEMKSILGNIERNVVFKSLVRMTIKNDDIVRPAVTAKP